MDGVVESPECISLAAAAAARIRRKSWRKEPVDEAEVEHRDRYNDNNDSVGDSESEAMRAVRAPTQYSICASFLTLIA